MEAGEVALGRLVVSGGDAPPGLQLVDEPLDRVPLLVEGGVVADGPTARGGLLLPVGGLIPLLRNDCFDAAFSAGKGGWRGTSRPCPRRQRRAGFEAGRQAGGPVPGAARGGTAGCRRPALQSVPVTADGTCGQQPDESCSSVRPGICRAGPGSGGAWAVA